MITRKEIFRLISRRALAVALAVAFVVGLGAGSAGCAAPAKDVAPEAGTAETVEFSQELPDFVYSSATSVTAYKLAPGLVSLLPSLPCYCDCGRASQHRSLKDCYFKEDGSFNDHASNCDVCQDEVIDVDKWQREGKSLREIRAGIDEKYRNYGRPTDTPPVE